MYKGKPLAYLDHNILDIFVKYGVNDFFYLLKEEFQVIYSHENLKEILRSGNGYSQQFLNVLNSLNAWQLQQVMEPPNFMTTGQANIIYDVTPQDAFDNYVRAIAGSEDHNSMLSLQYLMCGGDKSDTLEEIKNKTLKALPEFTHFPREVFDIYIKEASSLEDKFKTSPEAFQTEYKKAVEEQFSLLEQNKPGNEGDWPGVKEIRDDLGYTPIELNNISPPDVLLKIWALYKNKKPFCDLDWSADDFFQTKTHPIYPDRKYYNFEKVLVAYNRLNTIGYYPDKGAYKTMKRFSSASSDMMHASIATFTSTLFSCDKNFILKTKAIYEYLGISTEAVQVNI